MPPKLGRNDPCWCGSGKKYKHCHMRADAAARPQAAQSAVELEPFPFGPLPPEPVDSPDLTPEQLAFMAEWEQFENAGLEEKEALFLGRLEERRLNAEDAYEMLAAIRQASDPLHDPADRAHFAGLVNRLRREMPEVYAHDRAYYLVDLVDDALADGRQDVLDALAEEMAVAAREQPDEFAWTSDALLYYGQTALLLDALRASLESVAESKGELNWAKDMYGELVVRLSLFRYLETTSDPRADDPALVTPLHVLGLDDEDEWLAFALQHLSAPGPSPWQPDDFGAAVDAEQWQRNLDALLYEFMADRYRAGVPLTRSDMATTELWRTLQQQLAEYSPGKPSRRRSALVPLPGVLDRTLTSSVGLLETHVYAPGATMELLPAYLHFLARLGLIHPTTMDSALKDLHGVAGKASKLLENNGAGAQPRQALEAAWSREALDALRLDPDLAPMRARPVAPPSLPAIVTSKARTLTFKAVYLRDPEVWFVIEMRADQSLDVLHQTILGAVDFDSDHLYSFYLSGRAWDKHTEYAVREARHSTRVWLRDLPLRMKQHFLYLYDYGDEHRFDLQLVDASDAEPQGDYPRIVERHGEAPPQYSGYDDDALMDAWDEDEGDEGDEGDDEEWDDEEWDDSDDADEDDAA